MTVAAAALLLSCGSGADEAARAVDALPPIYPDYAGVTVPCNIAPLNFKIRGAERIRAEFVAGGEARFVAEGRKGAIEIPPKKWRALLADADVAEVRVSAWSAAEPEGVRYAPFRIIVSPEPIDERIAYRLIEPGYEGWLQMGIYQRDLTNFDEDVLVDNSVNSTGCVNCHSFRDYSPDEMLFHARGKSGGTVFVRDGRMKKVDLASTPPPPSGCISHVESARTLCGLFDQRHGAIILRRTRAAYRGLRPEFRSDDIRHRDGADAHRRAFLLRCAVGDLSRMVARRRDALFLFGRAA